MDKNKRYFGLIVFIVAVIILFFAAFSIVAPKVQELNKLKSDIVSKEREVNSLKQKVANVERRIKEIQESINSSQKKIYSPIESELGNETLFFTLYNDVIEMLHANSVKIKAIDYNYNPESDKFVQDGGKDNYFVCDINMELVSNYVNLGKLIQDIYQYPYYIRINDIDIKPYPKDKKILITNMGLRLYAHTAPQEIMENSSTEEDKKLEGAKTALPQ